MTRPSPLIILTPMRSFSSVVCAMLGRHPELYGFPELNLFIADRSDELLQVHARRPHGLHGLLRALAQVNEGRQDQASIEGAQRWLTTHRDWSTRQVFEYLLDQVAPRIGIDKSPRTVLKAEYLRRALNMFPSASFLHLTRHPRATCKSLIGTMQRNKEWGSNLNPEWIDPESVWVRAHQNIVDFTAMLPPGQWMRIRGEDLLAEPDCYLPQICEWLGVAATRDAIEAMMHPEDSPYACPGPPNAALGNDPDFLQNPGLRPGRVAEPSLLGDVEWKPGTTLGKPALKLARMFGYA
jgi:hypothetical protein